MAENDKPRKSFVSHVMKERGLVLPEQEIKLLAADIKHPTPPDEKSHLARLEAERAKLSPEEKIGR